MKTWVLLLIVKVIGNLETGFPIKFIETEAACITEKLKLEETAIGGARYICMQIEAPPQ